MKKINKGDLHSRVARAADATPTLEDRVAHAAALASTHPAEVQAPSGSALVPAVGPRAGRLLSVPLDQIDENPFNARRIYSPAKIHERAASIAAHGQDVPGEATVRNGRYILAAGHYRYKALRFLNAPTMDLIVYEGLSDQELYARSFRENDEREEQSALDNALAWRDLLDKEVFASESEIAEVTQISLSTVNKTMRILTLSQTTLDVIAADPGAFGLSVLYELALYEELAGSKPGASLALKVKEGEASRKQIADMRAAIESPKARKRKETSRPYKIQKEGVYAGSLKVWADSGRVSLDVVVSDPEVRSAILSDLKTRFGLAD